MITEWHWVPHFSQAVRTHNTYHDIPICVIHDGCKHGVIDWQWSVVKGEATAACFCTDTPVLCETDIQLALALYEARYGGQYDLS